jgi:hypothetical protein
MTVVYPLLPGRSVEVVETVEVGVADVVLVEAAGEPITSSTVMDDVKKDVYGVSIGCRLLVEVIVVYVTCVAMTSVTVDAPVK